MEFQFCSIYWEDKNVKSIKVDEMNQDVLIKQIIKKYIQDSEFI